MSSIIIDGYNVIGTSHDNRERARGELIDLLVRYKKIKMHDITVVFDGYKAGRGSESMAVSGGVAVIYSGLGERADEVIKRIISKERKEWIVVSSDKEIAHHAWSVNSIPVPSDAFVRKVSEQMAGKDVSPEAGDTADILDYATGRLDPDEEESGQFPRKGNAYKLSRREKSVRRALSKL